MCAECGCELVEQDPNRKLIPLIVGGAEQIDEAKRFLQYNKLKSGTILFNEKEGAYALAVDEEEQAEAQKYLQVFMQQKMQELQQRQMQEQYEAMVAAMQEAPEVPDIQAEDNSERVEIPDGAYLNSAQKAEDNRSSAWTLLLVGGIGMLVLILGMLNVLPFNIGNPYMFYGVMSAVFILFIVMGFVSMKNAKFFAKNAESENTLKNTLLDWCKENLTAEVIDGKIQYAAQMEEEVLYLQRYQIMKYMINHQFMNLDQELVERLIDDEVYDMVFPAE